MRNRILELKPFTNLMSGLEDIQPSHREGSMYQAPQFFRHLYQCTVAQGKVVAFLLWESVVYWNLLQLGRSFEFSFS